LDPFGLHLIWKNALQLNLFYVGKVPNNPHHGLF